MKVRSQRNSKYRRRVQVLITTLLVIIFGLVAPSIISGVSRVVAYPFHTFNVWLNESEDLIPTLFRDKKELNERIKSLENDLVISNRNDLTQRRLVDENNQLRKLLGIDGENRTVSAVIARPDELPYDLLQLDRGSNHGIAVGAPVFTGQDTVIGLVVHVAPEYSFVELITSPGFNATAFISGPDVVVAMEGMGGGVARVKVPQGISIAVGDDVYLPSIEPGVFGRISHLENEPTQPEQYGYITPDLAISSIYRVAVGKLSQVSQSPEEIDQRIRERIRQVDLTVSSLISNYATTSSSTSLEIEGL